MGGCKVVVGVRCVTQTHVFFFTSTYTEYFDTIVVIYILYIIKLYYNYYIIIVVHFLVRVGGVDAQICKHHFSTARLLQLSFCFADVGHTPFLQN